MTNNRLWFIKFIVTLKRNRNILPIVEIPCSGLIELKLDSNTRRIIMLVLHLTTHLTSARGMKGACIIRQTEITRGGQCTEGVDAILRAVKN